MPFDQLHRRELITLLGGAAAWPLPARAQQPAKLPTIGFLGTAAPTTMGLRVAAFVQRLREPEGENHEDDSCCCHSCDGDRSPRSGEGEAGAIGAPARLSVVGATRLLPRLPSEG